MIFRAFFKTGFLSVLCVANLLSVGLCHCARVFNTTDKAYTFIVPTRPGGSTTVDVALHSSQSVTGVAIVPGEPLVVRYAVENSWAQALFKPFSFLTRWGIGTGLVNEPITLELRAHSFTPGKTLPEDFQLLVGQADGDQIKTLVLDEEHLRKAAVVAGVAALKKLRNNVAAGA